MSIEGNVVIRTDSSREKGFGHIVRCCALASALSAKGFNISFITAGSGAAACKYIAGHGFPCSSISGNVSEHIEKMRGLSARHTILDSYAVNDRYRLELKKAGFRIAALDDIYEHYSHADAVINHNPSADKTRYKDFSGALFLGTRYCLINTAFARTAERKKTPATDKPRILVTMGGTDPKKQLWRIVGILDSVEADFEITVVTGFYVSGGRPKELRHKVEVIGDTEDMAGVMARCDAAITAGGVTCMELACMALPFLVFLTDKHQKENALAWSNGGVGIYAGDAASMSDGEIASAVAGFISAKDEWPRMGEAGKAMVDGQGAKRASDAIAGVLKR